MTCAWKQSQINWDAQPIQTQIAHQKTLSAIQTEID